MTQQARPRAKDALGRSGEELARAWVARQGMELLDANWRCPHGELDIVALDDDVLVFIEVKTRRSTAFGHPAEAVTHAKLARLRRLAGAWVEAHRQRASGMRIDVIAILHPPGEQPRIEHVRGVGG